jgi:hypothetical protein
MPLASRPLWRPTTFQASLRRCLGLSTKDNIKERQKYTRTLLKASDQKKNNDTRLDIEQARQILREGVNFVKPRPTTIQNLPKVPAFINGEARRMRQAFLESIRKADKECETMLLHLNDLRREAYKDDNDNTLLKFAQELDEMSKEKKEEMYRNLKDELDAQTNRARVQAETFKERVEKHIIAGGGTLRKRSFKGTALDGHYSHAALDNPFDADDIASEETESDDHEGFVDAHKEVIKDAEESKKAKAEAYKTDTKRAEEVKSVPKLTLAQKLGLLK